ncbi:MAG: CPBP family intramembrane glutamic endopeptidase [Methanobacteriota archaeon]
MNPEILGTLVNRLSPIPIYAALALVLWAASKKLKIERLDLQYSNKSLVYVLAALVYSSIATAIAISLLSGRELFLTPFTIGFTAIEYFSVMLLPAALVLRLEKLPLKSVGIARQNLKQAFLISALLIFLFIPIVNYKRIPTLASDYALLSLTKFLIVAAGEEIYFRGFVQLRCEALFGAYKGMAIATLLFGLYHLPIIALYEGTIPFMLVMNLLTVLIFGAFLAYLMHKTQNVLSPALVHAFVNWYPRLY